MQMIFPVILLSALIAGCSTVRVIENTDTQNYSIGTFEFATKDGKINTYVAGSPFPNQNENFKNSVSSMLYGSTLGRDVNFVSSEPNTDKYAFHIVVAFNTENPLSAADICEDATRVKSRPNLNTTSMISIFCRGGFPISYSRGYVAGLAGPQDPKLTELVRQVALSIIPIYDDHASTGDLSRD